MPNKNILTYNAKVSSVEQVYFSPVAQLINGQAISETYAFIARVDPWTSDTNPEDPLQTQAYLKSVYKNMIVLKKITSNDISPVIPRIDWAANTVYNFYQDTVDMFTENTDYIVNTNFYVRNSYDQVFKCLWNNNGAVSTVMPFFQPGTYGSNYIFQGADNYKWKYVYTIDKGLKRTFMDATWIPVPVGQNTPGPVYDTNGNQTGAWAGDIEVINVTNGGSGYQNNVPISISISGDGTGAAGYAKLSNGSITDIVVTNTGSNYSYSNVSITSASGSGATAIAPVSPVGGHGFDPVSEFGCNHIMYSCQFSGSDLNGVIPTDIQYRQVGLVINPTASDTYPLPANSSIYAAYTQLVVSPGFLQYITDELVYQGSFSNPSYIGTVLDFNTSTNVITLINIKGTPTFSASIFGNISNTTRTLLSISNPKILLPSGYLAYIENRAAVQRSPDGIEQFKFVVGY